MGFRFTVAIHLWSNKSLINQNSTDKSSITNISTFKAPCTSYPILFPLKSLWLEQMFTNKTINTKLIHIYNNNNKLNRIHVSHMQCHSIFLLFVIQPFLDGRHPKWKMRANVIKSELKSYWIYRIVTIVVVVWQ